MSRSLRRRIVLIAGAGLIGLLAVAVVIVIWSSREWTTNNQTSDNQSVTSGQQVKLTEGKPKSLDAPQPPSGMVFVPGGKFTMGRDDGDEYERPAHEVTVKPFFIDTYEVTNADFAKCVIAQQCTAPPGWSGRSPPPASAKRPVTGVRWSEANDYARFVGKRLPTEEEWEFAARGTDGRIYPWGNSWQRSLANANGARQEIADVGSFSGTSAFGAFDMVGNAWEWTASELRAYPGGRLPANLPAGDLKVIRGGSYESTKEFATATYRTGWPTRGARTYSQTGFRCAKDIGP